MKPPPFDYYAPESLDDARALLREHGDDAKILAGGQSLIPLLALRLARPAVLVDIGKIASLRHLTANGSLVIGAGVTQRQCELDPAVARHVPLLHEALPHIAHPQIRTRGTVCGSVAHGDPAAELPAVMLALDATITILGEAGTRSVPAEQCFVSYLETAVRPDEILLDVRIPLATGDRTVHAFAEISRRHGDFALAGAACTVDLDADTHVRRRRRAARCTPRTRRVRTRGACR